MRYAAGQLSQRLHLLRLGELVLGALQFRPRFMALGNVAHDIREPDEFAFLVTDRIDHHGRQEQRSILANTPAVVFVGSRGRSRRESAFGSTCRSIRRCIKTGEMVADDFRFGIALDALRSGIPARHYAARIEPDQCVICCGFREQSELPLAFA